MKNVLTWVALGVIFIDQITKYYASNIVQNTGAAFGLFKGERWFLILVAFIVIGLILYYSHKFKGLGLVGLGFLLGGTIGNLIDRLVYNYVCDFIVILGWPAFNFADIANVIGVVLLIIYLVREK